MALDRKRTNRMVNENHDPSDEEETILSLLKDGRDDCKPWGYTTRNHLKEKGLERPDYHIGQLTTAGWVKRVSYGFYKYIADPRDDDCETNHTTNTNTTDS